MLRTVRELALHSTVYGLTPALARMLGFVLLPVYTRHLTAAEYGVYTLLVVTGALVGIVVQSGLGSALFREMIYEGTDRSVAQSTALYYLIGAAGVAMLVMVPLSPVLARAIIGDATYARMLLAVAAVQALDVIGLVGMARLRVERRSPLFAAVSLTRFAATAGASIVAVAVLDLGVPGLIGANLAVAIAFSLVWIVVLRPGLVRSYDRAVLRRLLAFGVPLIPFGLGYFSMTYADRYLLRRMLSSTEVGQYAVGYQIGMTVALFVTAVQLAWPAVMFEIARQQDGAVRLARLLTYYVGSLGLVTLGLSVMAPEVLTLMATPEYHVSATVVPPVAVAYLLYGIMYMTNSGLETRNRIYHMTPLIVAAAVANLALNAVLIPSYGIRGAAWATVLSFAMLTTLNLVVNLRVWSVPYEYGRIARIALAMAVVFAASTSVSTGSVWSDVAAKTALLALYPLLLVATGFLDAVELSWLRRTFRSSVSRPGRPGSTR